MLRAKTNSRQRKEKEAVMENLTKEETTRLNVEIPKSLHKQIKTVAAQKGESITNIVTALLESYVKKNSNE